MMNQLGPGWLLHALVCRHTLNLSERGCSYYHHIRQPTRLPVGWKACEEWPIELFTWANLDTLLYEKKCSKSLQALSGHYPLPRRVVVRSYDAAPVHRSSLPTAVSSRSPQSASSPPRYANGLESTVAEKRVEESGLTSNTVELPTDQDPAELQSTVIDPAKGFIVAQKSKQLQHIVPTSTLVGEKHLLPAMFKGMRAKRDAEETGHHAACSSIRECPRRAVECYDCRGRRQAWGC